MISKNIWRECSVDKGLKYRVESLERRMIVTALRKANGVQAEAAKLLKISERVLRYKMKKYKLQIQTKMSEHYRIVELIVHSNKSTS